MVGGVQLKRAGIYSTVILIMLTVAITSGSSDPSRLPTGVATPLSISSPTANSAPTVISSPRPTNITTPTPTPSPAPFQLIDLEPDELIWDVAIDVPLDQVDNIRTGIDIARTYLFEHLGGDIPRDIRREIKVKIVATGMGNQELGGGGACCTANAVGAPRARLFFDVKHPSWDRDLRHSSAYPWGLTVDKWKSAAHEYAHGWQNALGCLTIHNKPLGDWMNEGIAEYVAYQALISAGFTDVPQVRNFMESAARRSGEADVQLTSLETNSPVWSGHIGYLAVEWLIGQAPPGGEPMSTLCTLVGSGVSVDSAFEQVFRITREQFYEVSGELVPQTPERPT